MARKWAYRDRHVWVEWKRSDWAEGVLQFAACEENAGMRPIRVQMMPDGMCTTWDFEPPPPPDACDLVEH